MRAPLNFACRTYAAGSLRRLGLFLLALTLMGVTPGTGLRAQEAEDPCARGKDLYRSGDKTAARVALEQCLKESGDQVGVLLPLTVMAIQSGRIDDGVKLGARAAGIAPDDPEARYWYGRALLRQGKTEEARAQWEQGMKISPNHKGILEGLARLAMREGEQAKAYNLLNQILQQGVDEPWLHRMLSDLAAGKGMWDQALVHLQAAMAKEGSKAPDLLEASQLSIMAGKPDKAVEFCRQAVDLDPGEATFGGLGEAYFATQEMDSALVYLRQAVALPDPEPRFVFNLANALEVSGIYDEAEDYFQKFLKQKPGDAVGHFNYGIHLAGQGRAVEGIDQVEQSLALDSSMLNARVVLAQMKEKAGDFPGAIAQVTELQRVDQDSSADLATWMQRLVASQAAADSARSTGKVHLIHMVLGSRAVVDQVQAELAKGQDFNSLVVRFSSGPTASQGGDIGWIKPADMKEPLAAAIKALGINETSPPVESGGLYHLFKRIP